VANVGTERKKLGSGMTVAECAAAVVADSFCGTRFFARDDGKCFCINVGIRCRVRSATSNSVYDAVVRTAELRISNADTTTTTTTTTTATTTTTTTTVPEGCVDSATWLEATSTTEEKKSCSWVADSPTLRCARDAAAEAEVGADAKPKGELVLHSSYCWVSSTATERKKVGWALSINGCARAVAADNFCGSRFHFRAKGSCMCVAAHVECKITRSTTGNNVYDVLLPGGRAKLADEACPITCGTCAAAAAGSDDDDLDVTAPPSTESTAGLVRTAAARVLSSLSGTHESLSPGCVGVVSTSTSATPAALPHTVQPTANSQQANKPTSQ
jgi:hypothetical protein